MSDRGRGLGMGEIGEDSHKAQTSSYNSFFIYWIFRWLHKLARNEFFFFFHTLQLKVETLGIRNSQGHFFIDETQTRLCVPALLASS